MQYDIPISIYQLFIRHDAQKQVFFSSVLATTRDVKFSFKALTQQLLHSI